MKISRPIIMDLVIVSDAKNEQLKRLTEVAIASSGKYVNIIIVESNKSVKYDKAITVHPDGPFNYNRFLNIGANYGSAEYIFFGNNDLIFIGNWCRSIIAEMERHNVVSASPFSPYNLQEGISIDSKSFFGHELINRFCGWAFVWRRDFFNQVNGLDEDFKFWCADNSAVEQLLENQKQHILVTSSLVQHIGSATTNYLSTKLKQEYTIGQIERFNKKFNKNLWDYPHLSHLKKLAKTELNNYALENENDANGT